LPNPCALRNKKIRWPYLRSANLAQLHTQARQNATAHRVFTFRSIPMTSRRETKRRSATGQLLNLPARTQRQTVTLGVGAT